MPICALHLISLHQESSIPSFLSTIRSSRLEPLLVARVIRWIITPTTTSVPELLQTQQPWHLFMLLASIHSHFPPTLQAFISSHWSIRAGVPSRLTQGFESNNHELLHPTPVKAPPLTGSLSSTPRISSSSQSLELSPELYEWITSPTSPSSSQLSHNNNSSNSNNTTAVSMLNLLSFHPNQTAKDSYLKYGAAFAESIGARHGGMAKIVGGVIPPPPRLNAPVDAKDANVAITADSTSWDEIAIAHYPSIQHFGDMLASADYQAVNQEYRVPSLKDTAILCMSEGAVEGMWEKKGGGGKEEEEEQVGEGEGEGEGEGGSTAIDTGKGRRERGRTGASLTRGKL